MNDVLAVIAALIVGPICTLLIFHRAYRDDLVRRVGLSILALISFSRIVTIVNGEHVSNVGTVLWIGIAMFFSSHMCSFMRRWLRRDKSWYDSDTKIMFRRKQ